MLGLRQTVKQQGEQVIKTVDDVQGVMKETEKSFEETLSPVRKGFVKRFPTIFLLMVTFGVALVFFSLEVILSRSAFVINHPWLAFLTGIGILVVTGTLYKKLD